MSANSSRKLLIVDDDPIARRAIARSLEDADFEIVQAEGPEQALELLRNDGAIKVVISDYHMKNAIGTEFLSRVEAQFPDVVRVLLTSDTSTSVFVSAVNDGHARRVLYKPWVDEQLRSVVRQSFGLPRQRPDGPVYTLKAPSSRTLTKLKALLGGERAD